MQFSFSAKVNTFHDFLLSILLQLIMHDLCIKKEIGNFNFKNRNEKSCNRDDKDGPGFPLCLIKSSVYEGRHLFLCPQP